MPRGDPAARRPGSSAPCCRSATRCARCCARRPPTSPGPRRRSGCASPTRRSSATSGRSTTPSSPITTDPETGEERETHRRPNLAPFADDPDCWLVASIEDYDLESGLARMGPIFRERVIAPPAAPLITLGGRRARGHAQRGRARRSRPPGRSARPRPGDARWRSSGPRCSATRAPRPGRHRTPTCLARCAPSSRIAEAAAALDPQYARNVAALREVQPEDLRPSDITARLGAPWIPTDVIEAFSAEVMGTETRVLHSQEIASWDVDAARFVGTAAGTSEWGTGRRNAGQSAARRAEQRHAADLRHRDRERRREARAQRRGDRGRQGEAGQDQGRLHPLDLDRSRPHRPARPHLQRPLQQPGAPAFRRPPPDPARAPATSSASTSTRSG